MVLALFGGRRRRETISTNSRPVPEAPHNHLRPSTPVLIDDSLALLRRFRDGEGRRGMSILWTCVYIEQARRGLTGPGV